LEVDVVSRLPAPEISRLLKKYYPKAEETDNKSQGHFTDNPFD
jgi:hypothetical protein